MTIEKIPNKETNRRILLTHNVHLNGVRAFVFCFGLSSSRYVEYAEVLDFLNQGFLKRGDMVLDIGCGRSILPSLLEARGLHVLSIDLNKDALLWQMSKRKNKDRYSPQSVQADGRNLPFKDDVFSAVTAISVLEHPPDNGDICIAQEIGRVLKPSGICILSVPLSPDKETFVKTDFALGIPSWLKVLLGSSLTLMFKKFNVDRQAFIERRYSMKDICERIVEPSGCKLQNYITFGSLVSKTLYGKIFPLGVLAPLEYLMAKMFLDVGKMTGNTGAVFLKLKKT